MVLGDVVTSRGLALLVQAGGARDNDRGTSGGDGGVLLVETGGLFVPAGFAISGIPGFPCALEEVLTFATKSGFRRIV